MWSDVCEIRTWGNGAVLGSIFRQRFICCALVKVLLNSAVERSTPYYIYKLHMCTMHILIFQLFHLTLALLTSWRMFPRLSKVDWSCSHTNYPQLTWDAARSLCYHTHTWGGTSKLDYSHEQSNQWIWLCVLHVCLSALLSMWQSRAYHLPCHVTTMFTAKLLPW